MVKWLEEITVTAGESDNFYHFHDNRVLPSHVTEQLAKSEGVSSPGLVALLVCLSQRNGRLVRAST